jgi:6-phosphogluconolactonase (cycloisomerase 2 family)
MSIIKSRTRLLTTAVLYALAITACGGGGSSKPAAAYNVGGTVTGLSGTGLVLQNNAGNDLTITGNGSFNFPAALQSGAAFAVTIKSQPAAPSQTCAVSGGTGTIASANVTTVSVSCTTNSYAVGGAVTGLSGSGLVLQNNGGNDLPVNSNGSFTFGQVPSGAGYLVTVKSQPTAPGQTCTVANGTGTVAAAGVANIAVSCITNSLVGGTVSGLSGSGLVLQDNGTDDLPIAANGAFSFATSLQVGANYTVTVKAQPSASNQTCIVAKATGTAVSGGVASVRVVCTTSPGRFAYIANLGSNNISAYAVDASSGALTEIDGSPFTTLATSPIAVTADANGKFLYCASSRGIEIFAIDPMSGALTETSGSPVINPYLPYSVTIDPTGQFAYTANISGGPPNANGVWAYSINATTGWLTSIGTLPAGSGPSDGAVLPSGKFLYITNSASDSISVFAINSTSGALTAISGSPFATGSSPWSVAITSSGNFAYVANRGANTISGYGIDPNTGALSAIAGSPFMGDGAPEHVALDISGKFLYATNSASSNISAYRIGATDGALSAVAGSPFTAGTSPAAVAIHPSGKYLYISNGDSANISAYTIDQTTGALTPISGGPFAAKLNPRGITFSY